MLIVCQGLGTNSIDDTTHEPRGESGNSQARQFDTLLGRRFTCRGE